MNEPLDASVTLEEVFSVVGSKRVPLAPELAGYLALDIAENLGEGAGPVDAARVYIGEEGTVAVVKPRQASAGDAEGSLRKLLAKLLEAGGAQTPSLAAVAKKAPGAGVPLLIEELEAALIPVNRAAGRRALARLAREVKRVTARVGRNASIPAAHERRPSAPSVTEVSPPRSERPPPSSATFDAEEVPTTARREIPEEIMSEATASVKEPPVSLSDMPTVGIARDELDAARAAATPKHDSVDSLLDKFEVSGTEEKAVSRELKAIAGLEPTPPPPETSDGIESLLEASVPSRARKPAKIDTRPETSTSKRRSSPDAPKMRERAPSFADERQLPTAPSTIKRATSMTSEAKPPKSSRDRVIIVILVVLLATAAAILWTMKPGFLTGRTPEKIAEERLAAEAESARIAGLRAVPQCRATLIVTDVAKNAEVLLRVGQAPADVEHMPIGARLEFVATAEGFMPKRAVVPGGAPWDSSQGKSRFELAIQLDKSRAKAGTVDPWPPAEPESEVGGKGLPGIVHVIATPKGAELWLLTGLAPEAQIEDLVACDADVEVLVAGPGSFRKRIHVDAKTFAPDGHPLRYGEMFHNADIAVFYELLSRDGLRAFYEGEPAERIV